MACGFPSDACTNKSGVAPVALFKNEFVVELNGKANEALPKALRATNETYGLKLFATVAATRALGGKQRGRS